MHWRAAPGRIAAYPASGATPPSDPPARRAFSAARRLHATTGAAKRTVERDRNVAQVTGRFRVASVVIRHVVTCQRRLVIVAGISDVVSLKAIDDQRPRLSQLGGQRGVRRCSQSLPRRPNEPAARTRVPIA